MRIRHELQKPLHNVGLAHAGKRIPERRRKPRREIELRRLSAFFAPHAPAEHIRPSSNNILLVVAGSEHFFGLLDCGVSAAAQQLSQSTPAVSARYLNRALSDVELPI